MYIDIYDYTAAYPSAEAIPDFDRLADEACIKMDSLTRGADGTMKLRDYFPIDPDDARRVKSCACKLVNLLHKMELAEQVVNQAAGYEETANGLRGKIISAVSAGNESITYSVGGGKNATIIDKALADEKVRDKLIHDTVREYLSGVTDSRGVYLLYMG